jgi:hypothetical protein
MVQADRELLYMDESHLSSSGAHLLGSILEKELKGALSVVRTTAVKQR